MKLDLSGKCLLEISGETCDACLAVLPNCASVAEKFGLKFIKIGVEEHPEAIEEYRLERLPSIIITEDGREIAKCSGFQPLEILELWVQAKLGL